MPGQLAADELAGRVLAETGQLTAHAGDAPPVEGGDAAGHEVTVALVHMPGQLAADELAGRVLAETGQLTAQNILKGLGLGGGYQGVLAIARQPLEVRLCAHGTLLGIEAGLGQEAHRSMRLGVFGAAPRPMGGEPGLHVNGIPRV